MFQCLSCRRTFNNWSAAPWTCNYCNSSFVDETEAEDTVMIDFTNVVARPVQERSRQETNNNFSNLRTPIRERGGIRGPCRLLNTRIDNSPQLWVDNNGFIIASNSAPTSANNALFSGNSRAQLPRAYTLDKLLEHMTLKNLPENDDDKCSICLECFTEQPIFLNTCQHFFHKNCIEKWALQKPTCPICIKNIVNGNL